MVYPENDHIWISTVLAKIKTNEKNNYTTNDSIRIEWLQSINYC